MPVQVPPIVQTFPADLVTKATAWLHAYNGPSQTKPWRFRDLLQAALAEYVDRHPNAPPPAAMTGPPPKPFVPAELPKEAEPTPKPARKG